MGPIDRAQQVITQIYRGEAHKGVDLRCVDDVTKENLDVIAPEMMGVIRQGRDGYGNYFLVAQPLESGRARELKFIHINETRYQPGRVIQGGEAFARCIIGGNSRSLHLHFETWDVDGHYNPLEYFEEMRIGYRMK